jgi:hypothetical protein
LNYESALNVLSGAPNLVSGTLELKNSILLPGTLEAEEGF